MRVPSAKLVGGASGVVLAIVGAIFATEGGFVDDKNDPGGATNHGITEQVARDHGYKGSMKDLPKEFAQEIYIEDYITKPGFMPMVEIQPAVAHKLIDAGVNTGTSRPSRWFQTSLNSLNRNGVDYPNITVDGKVGSGTINAYKSLERVRGKVPACEMMIKLLDAQQASYYISLTNLKTFTVGWVSNRIGNVPLSSCKNYEVTNG